MEEIIFLVEESHLTGFIAKGLDVSVYTQAETIDELKTAIRDAVYCHYDDNVKRIIRLRINQDETILA